MSEEQVAWADWLEAFGKAARHPLGIEYEGEPIMDYRDEHELIDGCGTPADQATAVRVKRYLTRVTGTLTVDILIPKPPDGYRIDCTRLQGLALIGPAWPIWGRNLADYLNGHEAIIGMVDDAIKADYLGEDGDFEAWETMALGLTLSLWALTYRPEGLILTILVDYDANS